MSRRPGVLLCRWCLGAWSVVLLVGATGPSGWTFRLNLQAGTLAGTLVSAQRPLPGQVPLKVAPWGLVALSLRRPSCDVQLPGLRVLDVQLSLLLGQVL